MPCANCPPSVSRVSARTGAEVAVPQAKPAKGSASSGASLSVTVAVPRVTFSPHTAERRTVKVSVSSSASSRRMGMTAYCVVGEPSIHINVPEAAV